MNSHAPWILLLCLSVPGYCTSASQAGFLQWPSSEASSSSGAMTNSELSHFEAVDYILADESSESLDADSISADIDQAINENMGTSYGMEDLEQLKADQVTTGSEGEQGQIFGELNFPQEITVGILNDVSTGELTTEEATERLDIMAEGQWLTTEQRDAAAAQAQELENTAQSSTAEGTVLLQESALFNDFGLEMAEKITDSVEVGHISVEEALAQIGDLEQSGLLTVEQADTAELGVQAAGEEFIEKQAVEDLSQEAIVQVYTDLENQAISSAVAYDEIEELMNQGIVQPVDGLVALDNILINN